MTCCNLYRTTDCCFIQIGESISATGDVNAHVAESWLAVRRHRTTCRHITGNGALKDDEDCLLDDWLPNVHIVINNVNRQFWELQLLDRLLHATVDYIPIRASLPYNWRDEF